MAMMTRRLPIGFMLAILALVACGAPPDGPAPRTPGPEQAPTGAGGGPRVVFLGDSLTAGYGLSEEEAYPARVAALLHAKGIEIDVVNAGVSGDTSAGGLSRVSWVLSQDPAVLVVGLGANDGLRGLAPTTIENNLRGIVREARQRGVQVVLLGMHIPPSLGPQYAARFAAIYPRLAEDEDLAFVPRFLEGVGGEAGMNLGDGIHPNAEGHRRLARNLLPVLEQALR